MVFLGNKKDENPIFFLKKNTKMRKENIENSEEDKKRKMDPRNFEDECDDFILDGNFLCRSTKEKRD